MVPRCTGVTAGWREERVAVPPTGVFGSERGRGLLASTCDGIGVGGDADCPPTIERVADEEDMEDAVETEESVAEGKGTLD